MFMQCAFFVWLFLNCSAVLRAICFVCEGGGCVIESATGKDTMVNGKMHTEDVRGQS